MDAGNYNVVNNDLNMNFCFGSSPDYLPVYDANHQYFPNSPNEQSNQLNNVLQDIFNPTYLDEIQEPFLTPQRLYTSLEGFDTLRRLEKGCQDDQDNFMDTFYLNEPDILELTASFNGNVTENTFEIIESVETVEILVPQAEVIKQEQQTKIVKQPKPKKAAKNTAKGRRGRPKVEKSLLKKKVKEAEKSKDIKKVRVAKNNEASKKYRVKVEEKKKKFNDQYDKAELRNQELLSIHQKLSCRIEILQELFIQLQKK